MRNLSVDPLSGKNIRNLFLYVKWWFACVRVQLFVLKLAQEYSPFLSCRTI